MYKVSPNQHHSLVEIDHENFSTVMLSLSLIQEGKLNRSKPAQEKCS